MIHFVFSADPLDPRRVDGDFAAQREALAEAGFTTSLVSDATFDERGAPLRGIPEGATVVYRGWMVDGPSYERFVSAVRATGASPLIDGEMYLTAHHLPRWYPLIAELTPETRVFPEDADLEAELRQLGWPAFFLKDYVKSLKTAAGSLITDPSEAARVIADMRRYRGVIEGGICVRRVEAFRRDSERRYFVLNGRAFAPAARAVPDLVHGVAARVPARFFSVDVAERDDGVLRVVELGDGQVSDLVGWDVSDFVALWHG